MDIRNVVNSLKPALKSALPFALIAAGVFLFFSPVIFSDRVYFSGEIFTQFYPWKHFLKSTIETGKIPFWNPFVFSGVPFLADIQKGSFYPPSSVFILFDFAAAFKIFIVSHFIFMGFSFYILLRHMAFSKTAALGGAFIFMFNSFAATRLSLPQSLASFALVPAVLWLFMRFLAKPGFYDFILLVLMLSAQALAGHAPTVVYTLLLLALYFIYYMSGERAKEMNLPRFIRHCLILGAGALCAFLLTMPQSGFFFELLSRSTLSLGVKYSEAVSDSMSFGHMISFLSPPGFDGTNPLLRLYKLGVDNFFSVTALFLVSLSLFYPKSRLYKFFFFVSVLSLLLALGRNTPVFSWFYSFLPLFRNLLHPSLAITMLCISLPVIAAYSIDHLKTMTLPGFGIFDRFKLPGKYFSDSGPAKLFRIYLILLCIPFLLVINHRHVYEAYSYDAAEILSFLKGYMYFLGLFGACIGLYFLRNRKQISAPFHSFVMILMITFELFFFVPRLNPSAESSLFTSRSLPPAAPLVKSSSRKFIHHGVLRPSFSLDTRSNYEMLNKYLSNIPSNTGILYALYGAGGNNPIEFTGYSGMLRSAFSADTPNMPVLNLLNAGYIISASPIDHPKLKKIYESPDFLIYSNSFAYPIFFVSEGTESPLPVPSRTSWTRSGEYDFSMLRVEVSADREGWLIFSNNYYPGWSAYVDNKATQIEKAFGIYMGVRINSGTSTVAFNYRPKNFGVLLSLGYFTFALLLSFALIYMFMDKKAIREL